jgi:hypothetical protein
MADLNFVVAGSCLHHLIVHRSEPSTGSVIDQGLGKVRARLIGDGRGEWAQVDEEAGTGFTVIVR